jgi:hypothetical protein
LAKELEKENQLLQQRQELLQQTLLVIPELENKEISSDLAPLPSTYLEAGLALGTDQQCLQWLKFELQLRVGIGHTLLEDLRHAIGLHHYLLRKVTKSARGDAGKKAASKQTASASKKKGGIIKDYIDNWK